ELGGDVNAGGVQVTERREGGARYRPVGQVDVGEADCAGRDMERSGPCRVRLVEVRKLDKGIAGGVDGRRVVGADNDDIGAMDRHGDRRGDDAAVAVVDRGDIVQRQRLTVGDE